MALHGSLKKLLPADYIAQQMRTPGVYVEPIRKRSTGVDFNGVRVSFPQYLRLKSLQEKALKLDYVMRKLKEELGIEKLENSPKWGQLVTMRQSLQRLLPAEHPSFVKRGTSMDFNGMQV